MDKPEIINKLSTGVFKLVYWKVDSTMKVVERATLKADLLPPKKEDSVGLTVKQREANESFVSYYDLDAAKFGKFKSENLERLEATT